jgi:hypothetical protein
MSTRRIATLVLLAVGCAECGFVQRATDDGYGVSYDELTAMIAEGENRRAANEPFQAWADAQEGLRNHCDSWDEALGLLYARRSSALVRDQTYISGSGTVVWMLCDAKPRSVTGAVVGGAYWALLAACLVPVDVVAAPIWFVCGAIDDLGVSDDDLVRAASDLQRARELGITATRVDGTGFGAWPYPYNTHLDELGFDAEWLRRRAPR